MSGRKLRRELKRPLDQVRALLQAPWEAWVKHRHDREFYRRVRITDGITRAGPKVAVFLIYQPDGLASSTLVTCAHLAAQGYATVLVSNLPLGDENRARLVPQVWKILERPNLGYDFGGYRDGLRVAREAVPDPEAALLLNDSIWWPVFPGDRTLTQCEASGTDVMGLFRTPFRPGREHGRPPFIHSYFYWFGPRALASPAFGWFWDRYRLSSFKFNAIRRGEMRFTTAMAAAGLTVGALYPFGDVLAKLANLDTPTLQRTLRYVAHKDREAEVEAAALGDPAGPDWRRGTLDFLARADTNKEFHLALHHPLHEHLGMNAMKKTANYPAHALHHRVRALFLAAVRSGDLPTPIPEVLAEIEATDRTAPAYSAP